MHPEFEKISPYHFMFSHLVFPWTLLERNAYLLSQPAKVVRRNAATSFWIVAFVTICGPKIMNSPEPLKITPPRLLEPPAPLLPFCRAGWSCGVLRLNMSKCLANFRGKVEVTRFKDYLRSRHFGPSLSNSYLEMSHRWAHKASEVYPKPLATDSFQAISWT